MNEDEITYCKEELKEYMKFMETAGENTSWVKKLIWYIEQLESKVKELEENSISIEVIKTKLEDLEKREKIELRGTKGQDRCFTKQMFASQKSILKKLLGRKASE